MSGRVFFFQPRRRDNFFKFLSVSERNEKNLVVSNFQGFSYRHLRKPSSVSSRKTGHVIVTQTAIMVPQTRNVYDSSTTKVLFKLDFRKTPDLETSEIIRRHYTGCLTPRFSQYDISWVD